MDMFTTIIEILETAIIAVSSLLVKKYVFLEPDVDADKRLSFYGIGFSLIVGIFLAFGKDTASIAVLILIGLSICLGRKKHRLRGMLLMIPILGIVNGLIPPIMLVLPFLFSLSEQETQIYQLAVYGVLSVLLILFFVKGRTWRKSYDESMKHRSLHISEKLLLCMVTLFANSHLLLLILANGNEQEVGSSYGQKTLSIVGIASMAAFILTITSIALIMQGNKRSF